VRRALANDASLLPAADVKGSHEAFHKHTLAAQRRSYEQLLAVYDDWVRQNPDNVGAALERCKFTQLAAASAEDEEELEPDAEEASPSDCAEELLARFSNVPAVLQFKLDQSWGEDASSFANAVLARKDIVWRHAELADFLKSLAFRMFWQKDNVQAARYARRARAADPNADVGLILATAYNEQGLRAEAINELKNNPTLDHVVAKVNLLVELEAFGDALTLIERAEQAKQPVATLAHARVLEELGRTEEARKKYGELSAHVWNRGAVLQRLFYIDVAKGRREQAVAAYTALRDEGFAADPFLRHRLALTTAFPSAPWQWRDGLGLLGLVGLMLLTALSPGLVLIPVHYVGLLRGARARPTLPAGERWGIRHAWACLALFLLAQTFANYLFTYDELHAMVFEMAAGNAKSLEVARTAVLAIILSAAVVLAWLRREDLTQWIRGTWSVKRTLKATLGYLALVYLVALVSAIAARAWQGSTAATAAPAGLGLTTLETMRALRDEYGFWLLFPLTAVVVPLYEEVAFRGVLLAAIGRYLPFGWANAVQAGLFVLLHDRVEHYPALFAIAAFAGVLVRKSQGLVAPIALHAAINTLAVLGISAQPLLEQARRTVSIAPSLDANDMRANCERGNMVECYRLALAHHGGEGVSQDFQASAKLLQKACDAGVAPACASLGVQHELGQAVVKDPERAASLYKRGCDADVAFACSNLARAYSRGHGVPLDHKLASELFRKACDAGEQSGCRGLGLLLREGLGIAQDQAAAAQLFQKACTAGDVPGCAYLALAHHYGQGVPKDLSLATNLDEQACSQGDTGACVDLASILASNQQGAPQDLPRAAQLLQQACASEHARGCLGLGEMYLTGHGVSKDLALAAQSFEVACGAGEPQACLRLAGMYERGEGVKRDLTRAKELAQKGVRGGSQ
jgi:uncharacterized protein